MAALYSGTDTPTPLTFAAYLRQCGGWYKKRGCPKFTFKKASLNMKKEPVYLSQKIKGVYKVDAGVFAAL